MVCKRSDNLMLVLVRDKKERNSGEKLVECVRLLGKVELDTHREAKVSALSCSSQIRSIRIVQMRWKLDLPKFREIALARGSKCSGTGVK